MLCRVGEKCKERGKHNNKKIWQAKAAITSGEPLGTKEAEMQTLNKGGFKNDLVIQE